MFKNYLKIALRTLRKYKAYSAINILGLAIGIACCVVIFMYVSHETSFDNYHKDFVKLVLIANLIAWPVAWYAMNKWLQDFAYRIDPVRTGWWIFALAGGLALAITLLTVSTQAIKAALANPVEALRYE